MLLLKTMKNMFMVLKGLLGEKYVHGPERFLSYNILSVFSLLSLLMVEREDSSKTPFGGPLSTFLKPASIASSEQHHMLKLCFIPLPFSENTKKESASSSPACGNTMKEQLRENLEDSPEVTSAGKMI